MLIASAIAAGAGCQLDEGGVNSCVVFGMDIGGLLAGLFVMGWFGLITLPTGFLALVGFSIAALIRLKAKRDPTF